jgi:ribosomal protein S24E
MHINIAEKKYNLFLKRYEVKGTISFEKATPSNAQLAEQLAKNMDSEAGLVVIKHIYTKFSHREADFEAVVYKSKEAKEQTEKKAPHERKKEAAAGGEKKEGGQ